MSFWAKGRRGKDPAPRSRLLWGFCQPVRAACGQDLGSRQAKQRGGRKGEGKEKKEEETKEEERKARGSKEGGGGGRTGYEQRVEGRTAGERGTAGGRARTREEG